MTFEHRQLPPASHGRLLFPINLGIASLNLFGLFVIFSIFAIISIHAYTAYICLFIFLVYPAGTPAFV